VSGYAGLVHASPNSATVCGQISFVIADINSAGNDNDGALTIGSNTSDVNGRYNVSTSNNTLDDGSGNANVAGYLSVLGGVPSVSGNTIVSGNTTATPQFLGIAANDSNTGNATDQLALMSSGNGGCLIMLNGNGSATDKMLFIVGGGSPPAFALGDGATNPYQVVTKKNTLDDGSGNMSISSEVTSYDGLTGDPESIKIPYIVYDSDLQAQTRAIPSLLTYTPTTIATLYVAVYADVSVHAAGTISVTVTYTNPNSVVRTSTYPFTDSTGSNVTALGAVGDYHGKMLPIRVKPSTAVTVAVTATGGYSGTFDVGGQIIQGDKF
jgi:hypothetical protein